MESLGPRKDGRPLPSPLCSPPSPSCRGPHPFVPSSNHHTSEQRMRSLWAVLAGWILIGILSFGSQQIMHSMSPWAFDMKGGTMNVPMLLLALLLSCVFGIVGCYVTARL